MASVEIGIEARIARLESDVDHMRVDIADIKVDLRALRDRVDGHAERIDTKIDALREELHAAKVWALLLYIALAGGMYATLARSFGWI